MLTNGNQQKQHRDLYKIKEEQYELANIKNLQNINTNNNKIVLAFNERIKNSGRNLILLLENLKCVYIAHTSHIFFFEFLQDGYLFVIYLYSRLQALQIFAFLMSSLGALF